MSQIAPDAEGPFFKSGLKKKPKASRRNLAEWRSKVITRDQYRCRLCQFDGRRRLDTISAHHLIFLSHCADEYAEDPRNGLTLCNWRGNGCHEAVHAGALKIGQNVLPRDVLMCMIEQGLTWGPDGPQGTLSRYFA